MPKSYISKESKLSNTMLPKRPTQRNMANVAGVSQSTISNWLKSPENIPLGKARILIKKGMLEKEAIIDYLTE